MCHLLTRTGHRSLRSLPPVVARLAATGSGFRTRLADGYAFSVYNVGYLELARRRDPNGTDLRS